MCKVTDSQINLEGNRSNSIWVRSWRCSCLVTWFCCHLIAKPGNKTAPPSRPNPYKHHACWWQQSIHHFHQIEPWLKHLPYNQALPFSIIFVHFSLSEIHMGQVMDVRLSCYLVLLSTDSKTMYKKQPHLCDLTHCVPNLPVVVTTGLLRAVSPRRRHGERTRSMGCQWCCP